MANNEQELETIQQIQSGLDKLEQISPVYTPDQRWFEDRVSRLQKLLRRRFVIELLLFLSVAFIVLSASLAALARMPVLYLGLQAAAVLTVPVICTVYRRKQVKDR